MQSIMMYGPFLQGTNVTVIKPKTFCDGKACEIGQRRGLSFLDIEDIASAYNCSKNYIFGNDRTKKNYQTIIFSLQCFYSSKIQNFLK